MIYLDNGATTYPKPERVRRAVADAFVRFGANPGRGGHAMSMDTAELVYRARAEAADFFHAPDPSCVVFTMNCTHALNAVIKGTLTPGSHAVVSCLEHNAVMRPLRKLAEQDVSFTQARVYPGDNDATVDAFRRALRPETKLIVCTHVSNVWGIRLPVERIAAMARQYGVPVCVDAAQSAGVFPVELEEGCFDFICAAPHKGLYAPMGLGLLITSRGEALDTILEGGTGTNSVSFDQPQEMPERLESGTLNVPAVAGLRAGLSFVREKSRKRILHHELSVARAAWRALRALDRVELFSPEPDGESFAPVFSFRVRGVPSEETAAALAQAGIAVRAGLHCAPAAHRFMGTLESGAVRICPSAFTTEQEIRSFAAVMRSVVRNSQDVHKERL